MMTDPLSRSFVHDFLNRQKQTYIPTLKETLLQSILHVCSCATTLFSFPGCSQGLLQADGCNTASSKKSENTQQNWFGEPEHGFKISLVWVLIVVKCGLLSGTISTLAMSRFLHPKLCETDRFRRFVCDLCIDRGQKQISGLRTS